MSDHQKPYTLIEESNLDGSATIIACGHLGEAGLRALNEAYRRMAARAIDHRELEGAAVEPIQVSPVFDAPDIPTQSE